MRIHRAIKMKFKLYIALLLTFILTISGCIVVKEEEYKDVTPTVNLSPKPELEMNQDPIRSKMGDMISFFPKEWFLVDLKNEASADIMAVAVNPDYSLSAVFKTIRKNSQIDKIVDKEGLLGLARLSFARHQRKSGGVAKQVGKYTPTDMGSNQFVRSEYTVKGGALNSKVVVFKSSLGKYYEIALIPMDIKGKPLPSKSERQKIFRSILATTKF